jgi:transcriptional regulator with XRE-family HTH domain
MKMNELFSKNLVRLRKLRGYSQRELGQKAGISYRMINYYENNPKSIPMDKLDALTEALEIKISDFFSEEGTNPFDDLDVRWIKKLYEIKNLPESDQKEINKHINSLIKKNALLGEKNK